MVRRIDKAVRTRILAALTVALFCVGIGPFHTAPSYAAEATPRSLKLSNAEAGAIDARYQFTFNIPTLAVVGSVRFQICSNTPLLDDSCTPPPGFNATAAAIASQSGAINFNISPSDSTANDIVLTRPPTLQPSTTAYIILQDIQNPFAAGSYYARVYTYASSNGSGPHIDAGGLAFVIRPSLGVSAEVPPHLTFCLGENITGFDCNTATEPFSDLGNMSPSLTSAAQSQMVIATNADNGYSMWVMGTPMTSGSNVLAAMGGGGAVKGTSQFGMNLRANSEPAVGQDPQGPGVAGVTASYNTPNNFRFASGDVLVTATAPDDYRKYTVSYVVNIPQGQPGGVYSTTLTYVCLANF